MSRNSLANTALHAATAGRHTDVALLLLDAGADAQVLDSGGHTAERIASENQLIAVVRALSTSPSIVSADPHRDRSLARPISRRVIEQLPIRLDARRLDRSTDNAAACPRCPAVMTAAQAARAGSIPLPWLQLSIVHPACGATTILFPYSCRGERDQQRVGDSSSSSADR